MRKSLVILATLFLFAASSGLAQDRVAQLNKVQGRVTLTRANSGKVDTARQLGPRVRNGSVFARDVVTTAAAAEAAMVFSDGSLLDLVENTSLAVDAEDLSALAGADKPEGRNIKVLAGDLLANVVPNPRVATRFETPSGVAAVKGTVLRIRSVRSLEDGGEAGIEIVEGLVDFHYANGGTSSLTSGTEIYAAFSRRGGLRVRVLFSPEPLDIRLGGFNVAMQPPTGANQLVEAVITVDEGTGGFTVENTSSGTGGTITITDPSGEQSEIDEGETSDELEGGASSSDEGSQTQSKEEDATADEDEALLAEDTEDAATTTKASPKRSKKRRSGSTTAKDDPCMAIICECGTCSNGVCVGSAGCGNDRICDNGRCLDPCDGAFCQCGKCQNGVCVGTFPGCPLGNACQSGVCVPVQSPTGG